jgi:hypothetical protein
MRDRLIPENRLHHRLPAFLSFGDSRKVNVMSQRYEQSGDESEVETKPPEPKPPQSLIEDAKEKIPEVLSEHINPPYLLASDLVDIVESRFGHQRLPIRWAIHELTLEKKLKALDKDTMPPETPIVRYSHLGNPRLTYATAGQLPPVDTSVPLDQFKLKPLDALWDWWRALDKDPGGSIEGNAYFSPKELAQRYGVNQDALRKRLERWRKQNPDGGWIENENRGGRDPKYIYLESAVRDIIIPSQQQ